MRRSGLICLIFVLVSLPVFAQQNQITHCGSAGLPAIFYRIAEEGRFTTLGFTTPSTNSETEFPIGSGNLVKSWTNTDDLGNTYEVSYWDVANLPKMDKVTLTKSFDIRRDEIMLAKSASALISERDVRLGKFRGREIVLEAGGARVMARMYIVGKRHYNVVVTLSGVESEDTMRSRKTVEFLDSFEIL